MEVVRAVAPLKRSVTRHRRSESFGMTRACGCSFCDRSLVTAKEVFAAISKCCLKWKVLPGMELADSVSDNVERV